MAGQRGLLEGIRLSKDMNWMKRRTHSDAGVLEHTKMRVPRWSAFDTAKVVISFQLGRAAGRTDSRQRQTCSGRGLRGRLAAEQQS